jgi:chorismate mutase
MAARGVRGATIAEANSKESIIGCTKELLEALVRANGLRVEDVACAWFTTTRDLNAEFPAAGARELGWTTTALLCGHEMEVPGALQRVVRVMLLVNSEKRQDEMRHVYLKEARKLRPLPEDSAGAQSKHA